MQTLVESGVGSTFDITVKPDLVVEDMFKPYGYTEVDPYITTAKFKAVTNPGAFEAALMTFRQYTESDEIIKQAAEQGFRPGSLPELVTLGFQHPKLNDAASIVALGSVSTDGRGVRWVANLLRGSRKLHRAVYGTPWHPGIQFLIVRK